MTRDIAPGGQSALKELRTRHAQLVAQVQTPIELPTVDLVLDLESRDSRRRKARHLQQMCMLQHEHLRKTSQFKLPYLTEMYLWGADAGNPFGLYSATRAIVEFSAFLFEVQRRLRSICEQEGDWRSRGEDYFKTIVRARFGTSDPTWPERMDAAGLAHGQLDLPKPFHVNDGLRSLAKHPDFEAVVEHYGRLCDYVHHNLSSQAATAEGQRIADRTEHPSGGGFVASTSGPMLRYQYPVQKPVELAVEWTAPIALRHTRAIVEWHNNIPSSPFSTEELVELTGSPIGVDVVFPAQTPAKTEKISRNARCPCGSGRKYKHCHGAA